jgi:hypothetical protein
MSLGIKSHRVVVFRWRTLIAALALASLASPISAQERLPWEQRPTEQSGGGYGGSGERSDANRWDRPEVDRYREQQASGSGGSYGSPSGGYRGSYDQPQSPPSYGGGATRYGANDAYRPSRPSGSYEPSPGYGAPYSAPRDAAEPYDRNYGGPPPRGADNYPPPRRDYEQPSRGYYTQNEILNAGHGFFGSVSRGLASAIEWAFQKSGRPNGYILGEDAGGAFIAGLRYGEGVLNTKDAGRHKVYWQGPSLGYDAGAEGSKTMVLVYNLRDPSEIYSRFGGVQGAAYLVGGVSVQLQKNDDVVLAIIRSGVGVRLGANVGYLKYTRNPTWNPF